MVVVGIHVWAYEISKIHFFVVSSELIASINRIPISSSLETFVSSLPYLNLNTITHQSQFLFKSIILNMQILNLLEDFDPECLVLTPNESIRTNSYKNPYFTLKYKRVIETTNDKGEVNKQESFQDVNFSAGLGKLFPKLNTDKNTGKKSCSTIYKPSPENADKVSEVMDKIMTRVGTLVCEIQDKWRKYSPYNYGGKRITLDHLDIQKPMPKAGVTATGEFKQHEGVAYATRLGYHTTLAKGKPPVIDNTRFDTLSSDGVLATDFSDPPKDLEITPANFVDVLYLADAIVCLHIGMISLVPEERFVKVYMPLNTVKIMVHSLRTEAPENIQFDRNEIENLRRTAQPVATLLKRKDGGEEEPTNEDEDGGPSKKVKVEKTATDIASVEQIFANIKPEGQSIEAGA